MPYLTYDEYNELEFVEVEEVEFNRLLKRASDAIDSITRHFYKFNNLADDVLFRQEQFKKAVACQIEYFHDMGASSSHELNSPLSVQIGRTQMSSGVANQQKTNRVISEDALMHLEGTGLLYRGIGVSR